VKPSFYLLLFGLVIYAANARGAEFDTYRYKLVASKDDKVCKHMEEVYNTHFKRPHDIKDIDPQTLKTLPQWAWRPYPSAQTQHLLPIGYSFYPTSPEFEAVKWQLKKYRIEEESAARGDYDMLVTELDIDNNGQKEIVVKHVFTSTSDSWEELKVFRKGEIDLSGPVTLWQLSMGQDGKHPPSYIAGGYRVRPFLLEGTTYLHNYNFLKPKDPLEKPVVYTPPEKIWVRKYKGGGKRLPEFTPVEFRDICEFDMIVTDKYIPKIN